jgi:hypothetical protein
MNAPLEIFVEGVGVWADALPGWDASRNVFFEKVVNAANAVSRATARAGIRAARA